MKFFKILFILLVANKMFAQSDSTSKNIINYSDNKTEYIFNTQKCKINTLGVFFAPEIGAGNLNGKMVPLTGGSFMVLLNKKLGVGFSGQITGSPKNSSELLKMGYGGLKLEYTIKPNAKFHATIPLIIGTGFANNDSVGQFYSSMNKHNYTGHNGRNDGFENRGPKGAQFFVIQPGINIEGNLMRHLKIFAGVNYRFATKVNNESTNSATTNAIKASQVSGISLNIGIKMGIFDYQLHKKDSLRKKEIQKHKRFR